MTLTKLWSSWSVYPTSIISKFFIVLNRSLLVRKLIATEQNPTAVAKSKNDKTNLLRHVTITINKARSKLTKTTIEQLLPKTPVQNQQ